MFIMLSMHMFHIKFSHVNNINIDFYDVELVFLQMKLTQESQMNPRSETVYRELC